VRKALDSCPPDADWRSFLLGDLPRPGFERLANHLSGCAPCARRLEALDGPPDDLVAGVARAAREEPSDERVPDRLLAAARSAFGGAPELVVDPGRRLASSLAQGPVRIGKFLLEQELGAGAFGRVFLARDTELDRLVALKVQRAPSADDEQEERFLREARSAAQLEHPAIVSLYEIGCTEDGLRYLVSEFIEGETLESRIGELDHRQAAALVAEVARALHHAHRHGVVHRDVKPSNVMIDTEGHPHVMDFGLAKRDVGESTVTQDGQVMGTPAYMSPELARGEGHHVDARSDVFSLGVVLYQLLTHNLPFQGNRRLLILQVLEDEPRPPRRLDEKIPRDLETICLTAMAKSPGRRFASAAEMADDLERFLRGEPIRARPTSALERLGFWCRRNPLAASLFAAASLGSAIGFWHLSRLSTELVESSALESAAQYSEMLEVLNDLYSSEVVDRVGGHGVVATAEYTEREGAIPLPATMLKVLLARIGEGASGMSGRLYSEYPFKHRETAPLDDFQRAALASLTADPSEPYYRIVDDEGGRPALHYAKARIMAQSCVSCHNHHPDSRKTDWEVGAVRGVLEVVRPLDRDERRTREGLRGTFALVGLASASFLSLMVALSIFTSRRRMPR